MEQHVKAVQHIMLDERLSNRGGTYQFGSRKLARLATLKRQITKSRKLATWPPCTNMCKRKILPQEFKMIHCRDRYLSPINGWGDCTMYFQTIEHGMSLVVELQIVHEKLLVVRENWSAHDAYEH